MTAAGEAVSASPEGSSEPTQAREAAHVPASVYLDTASAEPLHPVARETLLAALDRGYADPRRRHAPAGDARALLDNARAVIAEALDVRADEVVLTSSGTDATHRGLLGLAAARDPGRRGRVVHAAVEHSAVLHAARWWSGLGAEPVAVGVDGLGRCTDLAGAVRAAGPETVAVAALQSANHEVGTVQDPDTEALPGGVPLFVDACASMGRLPLPSGPWGALAGSAHKWGGPAGVGVLVVRRGARWVTPFPDDDRLDPRASGFENVPAALAAAAALRAVVEERDVVSARQHALVDRIRAAAGAVPDVEVVGDPDHRLPHLVTFSVLYVAGDALVDALSRRGYAVASGSACTASTLQPSHVLAAMGALTHGNVRVSLTRGATAADVERFCTLLPGVIAELRA